MTHWKPLLRRAVLVALGLLACALVFAGYLRPELVIDLGNRLGTCF